MQNDLCDDDTLAKAAQLMAQGDATASEALDALVLRFPNDWLRRMMLLPELLRLRLTLLWLATNMAFFF
jgi:hypothetical protein